ncbi:MULTISPECIES: hypothetical protein [Bradyrhizobium]|uniref:hypothetical protein n=1 Tax=Bradyrhizobium elkanii TaxID=29448 RepID=UPI002714CE2F|nr:hypothetical protein [Bradyrhizobium elkanii]WLA51699.1 hypothetical protein QIH80_17170 [Bradyrhizobium elkanii]WLB77995.1 hypothetical protein QIH83_26990 [Bradyrhizobium elkanii]
MTTDTVVRLFTGKSPEQLAKMKTEPNDAMTKAAQKKAKALASANDLDALAEMADQDTVSEQAREERRAATAKLATIHSRAKRTAAGKCADDVRFHIGRLIDDIEELFKVGFYDECGCDGGCNCEPKDLTDQQIAEFAATFWKTIRSDVYRRKTATRRDRYYEATRQGSV